MRGVWRGRGGVGGARKHRPPLYPKRSELKFGAQHFGSDLEFIGVAKRARVTSGLRRNICEGEEARRRRRRRRRREEEVEGERKRSRRGGGGGGGGGKRRVGEIHGRETRKRMREKLKGRRIWEG